VILYVETSAILRWLLGGADGALVMRTLMAAEMVFTSRLTLIEIDRVIVRQQAEGALDDMQTAEARRLLAAVLPQWRVVELIPAICDRGGQRFPQEPVRTLDALHLATALFVARLAADVHLLSTDHRVRDNAAALGLRYLPT
jgi:predicted nucleic acid-binding protein